MGYTRSAIKGISWMTALQGLFRLFTFLKIAVLARVLTPSQFGIFGIASLILAFLEILTETGINVLLIQSKTEISEYIDTAWVISILRGFIIFLGIVLTAPLITYFFNSPNALGIILLISISPLVRGFINPAEVNFQKNLKFNYEFVFRTSLYFIDAFVAVVFALLTHSVYSLALGLISSAALEVIISFIFIKPTPRFKYDISYLKDIFHRGKWVTGVSIFNYFGENGDNIVVGKVLGASSLGIYQVAYRIAILPITEISDVINKVIFPVYSKINEKNRLVKAFIKTTLLNALLTFIIGSVIFLHPEFVIKIILGPQWLSAVPILKALAIFGILRAVLSPASVVFLAKGRQKYLAIIMFARLAMLGMTIVPLVIAFGLVGAVYSQILSAVVSFVFTMFFIALIFK